MSYINNIQNIGIFHLGSTKNYNLDTDFYNKNEINLDGGPIVFYKPKDFKKLGLNLEIKIDLQLKKLF